ncbi:hypothetical protein [Megasphaera stantonii]|uniref:hypothetical protein n=1 Tax=Megasphaera stantonii TaxID=2144175 RepID=UPI00195D526E|nr:hypothetical protein [Megasphaera stantonii]MBM6732879.1 hypothetical protein [Megasphaera stantonii]
MTYTLTDYVRDHGRAPRRYIPHDWEPKLVHWPRPLMRYWCHHVYDGKPVRLSDGRVLKRGETV